MKFEGDLATMPTEERDKRKTDEDSKRIKNFKFLDVKGEEVGRAVSIGEHDLERMDYGEKHMGGLGVQKGAQIYRPKRKK